MRDTGLTIRNVFFKNYRFKNFINSGFAAHPFCITGINFEKFISIQFFQTNETPCQNQQQQNTQPLQQSV
jgi:hypothetical protein